MRPGDRVGPYELLGLVGSGGRSPDAKYAAYLTRGAGRQALLVRQITTEIDRVVVPPGPYSMIWAHSWARDGRLAFARGRVNNDIVLITSEGRK